MPHLSGISAEWVDHSRDEAWVAYVSYPDAQLWRARADGTARLRLTTSPMRVLAPRWSPDGTRLAFTGLVPRQPNGVFIVARDGGDVRLLKPGGDPTWANDGRSIAYHDDQGISVLEVDTGKSAQLPGSDRLFSPRWSPDGRYLVALSAESDRMMLYDSRVGRRWVELLKGRVGFPNWSRDGRHIYFRESHGLHSPKRVLRVRIDNGAVEPVMAFDDVRVAWGVVSFWLGLAPDDSPLFLRDWSSHEIYALDWAAP